VRCSMLAHDQRCKKIARNGQSEIGDREADERASNFQGMTSRRSLESGGVDDSIAFDQVDVAKESEGTEESAAFRRIPLVLV
jgi:hypothetical protein